MRAAFQDPSGWYVKAAVAGGTAGLVLPLLFNGVPYLSTEFALPSTLVSEAFGRFVEEVRCGHSRAFLFVRFSGCGSLSRSPLWPEE